MLTKQTGQLNQLVGYTDCKLVADPLTQFVDVGTCVHMVQSFYWTWVFIAAATGTFIVAMLLFSRYEDQIFGEEPAMAKGSAEDGLQSVRRKFKQRRVAKDAVSEAGPGKGLLGSLLRTKE